VVTDWDRFIALARRAERAEPKEALALLGRAIDLIDGPPFRASAGYSWAYSEGAAAEITMSVVACGETAVRLALSQGESVRAAGLGQQVLRVVDCLLDAPLLVGATTDALERAGQPGEADRLRLALVAAGDH
jgi:hypothetical protein